MRTEPNDIVDSLTEAVRDAYAAAARALSNAAERLDADLGSRLEAVGDSAADPTQIARFLRAATALDIAARAAVQDFTTAVDAAIGGEAHGHEL